MYLLGPDEPGRLLRGHERRSLGGAVCATTGLEMWPRRVLRTEGGAMRKTPATLVLLALLAAACSSKTGGAPLLKQPASTFPLTLTAANGSVTIASKPARIVSLSPTATEMLFAIGAGAQVVAVDDQSNYPPQAPKTKLSGFQPNVEAIATYHPDLVVASDDVAHLVASLKRISIPIVLEPAAKTIDDSYSQITQLGEATGHTSEAGALAASMRSRIQ